MDMDQDPADRVWVVHMAQAWAGQEWAAVLLCRLRHREGAAVDVA